jgi:predicted RNA-binding protein (virulence factor B family)
VLIYERSDLGYNVIINDLYRGLIYYNEIFQRVAWGDKLDAYVKKIRDDGKVDISLQKTGYLNTIDEDAARIIRELQEAGGQLNYSDKSDPLEIQSRFGLSKKAFKRALGNLYKQKLIDLDEGGFRLL